ncbi:MAG: aldehyde dehydrogenase [Candidatus Dormibacteraeota bacterium]|nr:aldehyde dehydrogenase [Candidatus Dormibacteraeota bacterium]
MAVAAPLQTSRGILDQMASRLFEAAPRFAALSIEDRRRLLEAMSAGYARVAPDTVRAACEAKRIPMGSPLEGEEWTLGPVITLHNLRQLRASLASLGRSGTTRVGTIDETVDGRERTSVFPAGALDAVLFRGVRARSHLQPGARATDRAGFYRRPGHAGVVVLVLGAGNVNAITPLDVTSKLFNEGKVCLVKMNPVNAYLGPFLEVAFADAIAAGYLAIAYGGVDEGEYLAHHPAVDEIHLTGSDRTHDALLWGEPGPARDARKAEQQPLLSKPITSELGNISPVIVVPGSYTRAQLAWQAENVAAGVVNNASFNCNANKMLITGRGTGGAGFIEAIEEVLRSVPPRYAYYPGAQARYRALTSGDRHLDVIGRPAPGALPWTIMRDLDPEDATDSAFRTEPFCSILSQTSFESADPLDFLDQAVQFANMRLWGTLVATIVVPPRMLADPALRAGLDRAIAALHYGTVGVNIWGAYGFAIGTPWGGHPSASLADIQSGLGFVHNTAMLEGVEKTVLEQPIVNAPKPIHFPSHRTARTLGRRLSEVEATGSWAKLPGVLSAALRG